MPDQKQLTLQEQDGEYYLKINGRQLMSSFGKSSELLLADLPCKSLARESAPRILIGGLGLGFTLQRALDLLGPGAIVHVAELIPEVPEWNREYLGGINGRSVEDRRVTVFVEDVHDAIARGHKEPYDAILLDVDNGPVPFSADKNNRLYSGRGLRRISDALKPGGRVAFWSACEDRVFADRIYRAGFEVHAFEAKPHERAKQSPHRIYIGQKPVVPRDSAGKVQATPAKPKRRLKKPLVNPYGPARFKMRERD
ncbi:MAG: spermine synthase [Chthoniobacteraceae bacterium]